MNMQCSNSAAIRGVGLTAAGTLALALLSGQALAQAVPSAPAQANGFSGYYSPANWTETNLQPSQGSMDGSGAPSSVKFISANDGSGKKSDTYFSIQAAAAGTVAFDWSYSSVDDPGADMALFFIGSLTDPFKLSSTSGESGHIEFAVAAGELFGFNIFSLDSSYGSGTLTVTHLLAPLAPVLSVPEPATYGLMALGLVGIGARVRRRCI